MSIRLLPQNLINQIAAGEVVERPSSALKELIENAVDAGATRIDIKIQNGGKTFFSVTDNGKGMTKEELTLAVERHATSKLPHDDLFEINFLGFRGEALPSIGSVAKLSISSRTPDSAEAWNIKVEGGHKFPPVPTAHPIGTTVEVKELFFATPARLKFLKSDQSEYLSVKEIVNRIAMAYPHIQFILSDEKRQILNYPIVPELFDRVAQVIGKSFHENAVPIDEVYDDMTLKGFVSLPTYTRSTGAEQYLFVNGRFIRDKLVTGAVRGAYQGLIGHDAYPVLALFLKLSNENVDVNVHPAKIEVRFKESAKIRGFLVAAIRNALAQNGFKTATTIGIGALEKSQPQPFPTRKHISVFENNRQMHMMSDVVSDNPSTNWAPDYTLPHIGYSVKKDLPDEKPETPAFSEPHQNAAPNIEPNIVPPVTNLSESQPQSETFPPLGYAKAQLYKTYIISQTADSIIIIDQHAAHERLTYEKLAQNMATHAQTQLLLIPEVIELSPDETMVLSTRANELKDMGFVIDAFGRDCVAVREIPALLSQTDIQKLVQDLADTILEYDDTVLLKDKMKDICARIACHGSVRAGRVLTIDEMNALLRQMEECATAGQCIHGRPTYIELKLNDIERLFGRKK